MQRLSSSFPAGLPGAALVILRICLAVSLLVSVPLFARTDGLSPWMVAIGALALALCLGVLTPVCCCLAILVQCADARAAGWPTLIPGLIGIFQTLALSLLGAGAYSLDARLYGRRVVILSKDRDA